MRRERISLRGICRAVGVSLTWLLHSMVERFAACPEPLHVQLPVSPADIVIRQLDADEIWSFVQQKAHKPWIWIAMDAKTRQIMAFYVGDRRRDSAKPWWAKILLVYREQATFHTDQYDAYTDVIPAERHKAITKYTRKTDHIERFNNALRQRASRLVRETFTISQKPQHYMCSITKRAAGDTHGHLGTDYYGEDDHGGKAHSSDVDNRCVGNDRQRSVRTDDIGLSS